MRKLFFAAVLCVLAWPAFATDYWQGLLIVANVSHGDAEATVQAGDTAEIAHSAIIPVRVMLPYGDPDGVTYLVVYQPMTSESSSCLASSSWASIPATSWYVDACTIGHFTGAWTTTPYATRALAVTAFNALDSHAKLLAIGPVMALTGVWLLTAPNISFAFC